MLGTTLESVKQRFGRMGLEVSWHGTGQVLLPSDVLDAFLLALAECLENVRRHCRGHRGPRDDHRRRDDGARDGDRCRASASTSSDVDSATTRLQGVGGRHGCNEVGGNARLFSAAGAGTTVVLEVPQ